MQYVRWQFTQRTRGAPYASKYWEKTLINYCILQGHAVKKKKKFVMLRTLTLYLLVLPYVLDTNPCSKNRTLYEVWKDCQPKSFCRAQRASGMSDGKGAGELIFERRWRKWVRFYRITPHLAYWNCYQMWTCSVVGIYDKLRGGCAECQMT